MEITETLYVKTREEWREWLIKHLKNKKEIWFVFYKKATSKPTVSYSDAVEEALCYGWIDGIRKKVDDERYTHRFSPRHFGSNWSEPNKARALKMLCEGKMTNAGIKLLPDGLLEKWSKTNKKKLKKVILKKQ